MRYADRTNRRVAVTLLLSLCTLAPAVGAGENMLGSARRTAVLDVPGDAELFAAYERDRVNQKVQSWGQYRGWSRPSTKVT